MKKQPASALLLSFLMMTLVITVSLGVSFLLIEDVGTVRTKVAGIQSLYAAEGATERGLQVLKESLPGYEPTLALNLSNNTLATLTMNARGFVVPCSEKGEEWGALANAESVQLALYTQEDAEGKEIKKVERFYVEFYVGDAEGNPIWVDTDVLRWKILGLKNLEAETEAISEFIPMEVNKQTPLNPSIFGSAIPEDRAGAEGYSNAKFQREVGGTFVYTPDYPIIDFLRGHDLNTLIMTNVVQRTGKEVLYYRLHSVERETACSIVQLNADGEQVFGSARNSLDTRVQEGENLPVFDFVLYNTDGENESQEVPLIDPGF